MQFAVIRLLKAIGIQVLVMNKKFTIFSQARP